MCVTAYQQPPMKVDIPGRLRIKIIPQPPATAPPSPPPQFSLFHTRSIARSPAPAMPAAMFRSFVRSLARSTWGSREVRQEWMAGRTDGRTDGICGLGERRWRDKWTAANERGNYGDLTRPLHCGSRETMRRRGTTASIINASLESLINLGKMDCGGGRDCVI